jgi:predicted regulator of Ras-like GTPase activity (Roadblock/LC7/MglB family)
MLNDILKALNENGFKASVFANSDGLILASDKKADVNEKVIAAMIALLSDAAEKAKDELELKTDMHEMKIKYHDACILCRQIKVNEESSFLLAAITPPQENDETEKYQDQLMDWAVENGKPPLVKLVSL